MSLTNLLYNYKNSAYVASIIFLLSFSISYFVMGTVIQDNSDNWIDDISYQKVGGDLTASRLIEGKYNATENASIYEFSHNHDFLPAEVIGLVSDEYQIFDEVPENYLTITGIAPQEYSSVLSQIPENLSIFQTMNDNVSYGLIDEEDHLEYNINSGDLLNVTNGNHSDSILIVGVAKSLPTISRRYTLDLVIHRNNSIIIQELGLENRYLVIQYMFKDNSSTITTDEFQSELNENFSEFDFHFLNRNSLLQNFYNPTLTFGVIPSLYTIYKN